jgi:hypothetical protein
MFFTLGLLFITGRHAWFFYIPIPAAAVVGCWRGDRALVGMLQALSHFWS